MSEQDLNLQESSLSNDELNQSVECDNNMAVTTGGDESLLMADASDDEALVVFDDLGLSEPVLQAVKKLGFEAPTPIQERSIPLLMEGHLLTIII